MDLSSLAAIPWHFADTSVMKAWIWDTPHFRARVTLEPNAFAWVLEDRMVPDPDGNARFLNEGRAASFPDAEREVREHVGKAYPRSLGYEKFAGRLAKMFQIVGGTWVDFGEMEGSRSLVTVRMPNGTNRTFTGTLRVSHYEIMVEQMGGHAVKIQPSYIVRAVLETGATGNNGNPDYTGFGRVYRGASNRNCTGLPGFLDNTIDHSGRPQCPVHEAQVTIEG